MLEHMEISEYIYEVLSENFYKQYTRAYSTRAGHSRKKRRESASPNTHPAMSESAVKRRKKYLDYPKGD